MSPARAEPVAIAVLARAPVPGFAKTRLVPHLGAEGAAALQEQLTARAVATACASQIGAVMLWTTPDISHASFRSLAQRHPISLAQQPDADLGARMHAAIVAANGPALVIGTDCPALTPRHLRDAADALCEGLDAVLCPAEDGGYVLIGLREPHAALFTGLTWSSDSVAAETRRRLARLGLSWREPARLWDVDRPEDLSRLTSIGLADQLDLAPIHSFGPTR
jgi:hypothetical protein